MGKFTLRIGFGGFAIACALFAASLWVGHATRLESLFWPTAILLSASVSGPGAPGPVTLAAVGFSAVMNGAFYFGVAWLVWWVARLAGIAKTAPSEKARFVSFFLAVGLGFSLLVALAEAAFHRMPKFTAHSLMEGYLVTANLIAVVVLTCAPSGWGLWWLRGFLARRVGGRSPRN